MVNFRPVSYYSGAPDFIYGGIYRKTHAYLYSVPDSYRLSETYVIEWVASQIESGSALAKSDGRMSKINCQLQIAKNANYQFCKRAKKKIFRKKFVINLQIFYYNYYLLTKRTKNDTPLHP